MPTLPPNDIKAYAEGAGFSDAPGSGPGSNSQATVMTAIAMAESGGRTTAHNNNPPDNSYGLWQINMLGSMGPTRRQSFGISSNSELFDPEVNAKAAKIIFDGQGYGAWSVYTNGSYRQHLESAASGEGLTTSQEAADNPASGLDEAAANAVPSPADIVDGIKTWLDNAGLRIAMFIGGGALILLAIGVYLANHGVSMATGRINKAIQGVAKQT